MKRGMKMASDEKVSIKIPKSLYDKIQEKIQGTSFSSVDG